MTEEKWDNYPKFGYCNSWIIEFFQGLMLDYVSYMYLWLSDTMEFAGASKSFGAIVSRNLNINSTVEDFYLDNNHVKLKYDQNCAIKSVRT